MTESLREMKENLQKRTVCSRDYHNHKQKQLFVKTFTKRFGNHLTRKKLIELKVLPQKQLL